MKKYKKIAEYFDSVARNYYHKNIKVDNEFFKFIAKKINSSDIYCKSEYVKARSRLYKKISYFKKNQNIISLSEYTGISMDELLKFVISSDLKLTKNGIDLFKRIYDASVSAYKSKEKNKTELQEQLVEQLPEIKIILTPFLIHLKKQLQYPLRTDGRINVRIMQNGIVFYSNNAIYQALKTYFKDENIDSPAAAKKYMVQFVNQLRDRGLLAKKINEGYYSNSFIVKDGDGKVRRENGVFMKNVN